MSILSIEFLILMAILLVVNYCLPVRFRWLALLAASLTFYAFSGWEGMAYMGVVTLITWAGGLYVARCRAQEKLLSEEGDKVGVYRSKVARTKWVRRIVVLAIAGMAVFKYTDIVYNLINKVFLAITESRSDLKAWTLIAPLGLSYFTFQSIGYLVDCHRGRVQPEKNPLKYLLFLCFFPQINQGPITTHKQLMPQLLSPARFEPQKFVAGFQLMLWGYFKKLVLADRLAYVTASITTWESQPGWMHLMVGIVYLIRLYGDFSGGMDVIRGAAQMLGIEMAENFRRPFFSISVAEYWRRWHISLGAWFRAYLFYPLTTSRFGLMLSKAGQRVLGKKIGRALPGVLATFLTFLLIGVWHVANWNAVIYGVYFGVLLSAALLLEPLFKKLRTLLHINPKAWWWKGVGLVRTWVLVLLPQYFAFTYTPDQAMSMFKGIFNPWTFDKAGTILTEILTKGEWNIAVAALIVVLLVDLLCEFGVDLNGKLARSFFLIRWVVLIVLILVVLIFGVYGAGFDASAFLYTQV